MSIFRSCSIAFLALTLSAPLAHAAAGSPVRKVQVGSSRPAKATARTKSKASERPQRKAKTADKLVRKLTYSKINIEKPTKDSAQNSMTLLPIVSDPKIKVRVEGGNTMRIKGIAFGPTDGKDALGVLPGVYAKSVQVWVDKDLVPGGRERNKRRFMVYTSPGATSVQIANALAKQVNKGWDFRATVVAEKDGLAKLVFSKR